MNQKGLPAMQECQAQGVKVHVAGVYGAGVLVGNNTHNYVTADEDALALGQRWAELAAAHVKAVSDVGLWDIVSGIEVGNEIDKYPGAKRPATYSVDDYEREFAAHVAAYTRAGLPPRRVREVRAQLEVDARLVLLVSVRLVPATCPCHVSMPRVNATCPCHVSMPRVHAQRLVRPVRASRLVGPSDW